jgi:hypothetical protein
MSTGLIDKIYYNIYKSPNGDNKCKVHTITEHTCYSLSALKDTNDTTKRVIYINKQRGIIDVHDMKRLYTCEELNDINDELEKKLQRELRILQLIKLVNIHKKLK